MNELSSERRVEWDPAKRRLSGVGALAILSFALAAAGAAMGAERPNAGSAKKIDFETEIQPILDDHCVMCHMTGAANGNLVLEQGQAQAYLINVKSSESGAVRVVPGKPDESYLIHKLDGTQGAIGGQGAQMPLGSPPLSAASRQHIAEWIRSLEIGK